MPSAAHWDDLTTANITVQATSAQISLVYPSELTAFADDNDDGRLSGAEIARNRESLQNFFQDHILLEDDRNQSSHFDCAVPSARVWLTMASSPEQ